MIDASAIHAALRTRLLAVPGLPADRELEDGETFVRPAPTLPYLRETFLPSTGDVSGMPARTGRVFTPGLYQIDLFYPQGAAHLATANALAAAICRAFRPRHPEGVLATGDPAVAVRLRSAARLRWLPDRATGRQMVPVQVVWEAEEPNA